MRNEYYQSHLRARLALNWYGGGGGVRRQIPPRLLWSKFFTFFDFLNKKKLKTLVSHIVQNRL